MTFHAAKFFFNGFFFCCLCGFGVCVPAVVLKAVYNFFRGFEHTTVKRFFQQSLTISQKIVFHQDLHNR